MNNIIKDNISYSVITYTIKYRFRTLRGKTSACRNINSFSQALVLYKELLKDEQVCDIVVERKTIDVFDNDKLNNLIPD